jgi:hypothetical protein
MPGTFQTGAQKSMNRFTEPQWIWDPSYEKKEVAPVLYLFRKKWHLPRKPVTGECLISADTRYKLYLNEQFVQFGPAKGNGQHQFYDVIDLLPYLRQGDNIIAVEVLRYPSEAALGNHSMIRGERPGLLMEVRAADAAGGHWFCETNDTWRCIRQDGTTFVPEEERFAPLYVHEISHGVAELQGWKSLKYVDASWQQAAAIRRSCELRERNIPFLYRKKRTFSGIMELSEDGFDMEQWSAFIAGQNRLIFAPYSKHRVVLNAGEEMTGFMYSSFIGGAGTKITWHYGESYVYDETIGPEKIPMKGDRLDYVNGHLQGYKDHYKVVGSGTDESPEVYEPFWFRTFRFVELTIEVGEEPLTYLRLSYEETGYPLDVRSGGTTSDASLTDIWELSERTLRRCMHESYEDCPFYEQLQYLMDTRSQILYTYAISADDRLARKCMEDFAFSQRKDGLLNCSYPNCAVNVIPGFSIYYILMLYDHMMYFGDKAFLQNYQDTVERILNFFDRNLTPQGYVGKIGHTLGSEKWSFIDWALEWNDTNGMPKAGLKGPLTMESLLYLYGLQHAAVISGYVGDREKAHHYEKRAEALIRDLQRECMDAEGYLTDGPGVAEYSEHCQVFGILTGVISENRGKDILKKVVDNPAFVKCTVAMKFYLYRALEKVGLYSLTEQGWDTWRSMIAMHATTSVEAEAYCRSDCHGWGALILYELPSVILGVRPAAPGYEKIQIRPVPGYLNRASGQVITPKGLIKVQWQIIDGKVTGCYQAPENTELVTELQPI